MQYTEEHYAQLYNDLPEGLKDLVLSGRLAILVSAIGSRHGLNADQISDLEPAIEDVCLGLITTDELVENIKRSVDIDERVANRIAAESELEILRPFGADLLIARKQKEELDKKIGIGSGTNSGAKKVDTTNKTDSSEPKNVSGHSDNKKITDWYNKDSATGEEGEETENVKKIPNETNFDWDKNFIKPKKENIQEESPATNPSVNAVKIESKIDELTETINKLVNSRFGTEQKNEGPSTEMQALLKRLEQAEKENAENKKLIKSLQDKKPLESIFGTQGNITGTKPETNSDSTNKIQIDKQRKVEIDHTTPKTETTTTGNIQITSVSKQIPIQKDESVFSSAVSKDTLESIVETRNNSTPTIGETAGVSAKKSLTLEELISGSDNKIKEVKIPTPTTLVFPGVNEEKTVDIKDMSKKDNMRQTLLDDLYFLKSKTPKTEVTQTPVEPQKTEEQVFDPSVLSAGTGDVQVKTEIPNTTAIAPEPLKEELVPKTKEDRMRSLQDKIKSLNKGVNTAGGNTNISASGLDPYRL